MIAAPDAVAAFATITAERLNHDGTTKICSIFLGVNAGSSGHGRGRAEVHLM